MSQTYIHLSELNTRANMNGLKVDFKVVLIDIFDNKFIGNNFRRIIWIYVSMFFTFVEIV